MIVFIAISFHLNAQFSENFDSGTTLPAGWSTINGTGTYNWSIGTPPSGLSAYSGSNVAKLPAISSGTSAYLITKQIAVVAGVNDRLIFRYTQCSNLQILISKTNNTAASFLIRPEVSYNFSYQWNIGMVDLSQYAGQSVYVAFVSTGYSGFIDNVVNDVFIPSINSDCNGFVNVTSNQALLIGNQNPADVIVTYTVYVDTPVNNQEAYNMYQTYRIIIYAKIENTVTGIISYQNFYILNKKISFFFMYSNERITGYTSDNANETFEWFDANNQSLGQNPYLYSFTIYDYVYQVYTNNQTGCTVRSGNVYRPSLFGASNLTINQSDSEMVTSSEPLLMFTPTNAMVQAVYNWPNGVVLNQNQTISVLPEAIPGIYNLTYNCRYILQDNDTRTSVNYSMDFPLRLEILGNNNGIRLNAFVDENNNGIQETTEKNFSEGIFSYQKDNEPVVYINSSAGEAFINANNPLNVFNLNYNISPNASYCGARYTVATSAYPNVTVAAGSGITTYNFALTPVTCNDLAVTLRPSGQPRPGFTYSNYIGFKNAGNQVLASGMLTFTKSNLVTITAISDSGVVQNTNGFTYLFSNLLPGEQRYISVTMQVPTIPTVALGDVVTNSVAANSIDPNPANDAQELSQIIVGSYDPNDKSESHGGKIERNAFSANDYLTYTIQFENKGTAAATHVRINDVLDAKLEESTVTMVASSHPYELNRKAAELNWNFNGIGLPVSVANSDIGKGYVVFRVKPKSGFAVGDIIPNKASIYFDFNPAIVTNTYNTEFINTLATQGFNSDALQYGPNPVKSIVTVKNDVAIDEVEIISSVGQRVFFQKYSSKMLEINMEKFTNGLYFMKIKSGKKEKNIKLIKE